MWTYLYLALFFGTLIALLVVLNVFTRRISELERRRAELQLEEDRVFDFLHGLGEAFSEGLRSADLHRLIVEGATRILDAHGGALYLSDKSGSTMVPVFISKGCPPLVPVPAHILEQSESTQVALESYLKLTSVKPGEGPLGQIWTGGKPKILNQEDLLAAGISRHASMAYSLLAAPLIYRRKALGIIALANGSMTTPFSTEDLKVFQTITEQSAFALYSEAIYLEASEKKRLDHDLEIAREIQSILLPAMPPAFPGYDLSGVNIPARQVSGDYFDYIKVDDSHLGIAIADVSGKGIPASLIMAMARSVLRSEAAGNFSAAEVLRRVNRQLYPDIKEDMFISMAYLVINATSGEVTLARAGHDAPLFCHAGSLDVEKLSPKGMALGIDSGEVFNRVITDHRFEMKTGDCLLLYTDGTTEAMDDAGLEFGMDRMVAALQGEAPRGARQVVSRLTEDLRTFVGNHPKYDDVTMIAIRKQ
jgi:sigma-B regulation protein RsbU (phosphoserine phosphatase)